MRWLLAFALVLFAGCGPRLGQSLLYGNEPADGPPQAWQNCEYHYVATPDDEQVFVRSCALDPPVRGTLIYCYGAGESLDGTFGGVLGDFGALQMRLVGFDYRGFGHSSGTPTEDSLRTDARAVFDEVVAGGTPPDRILIVGFSLGGAVAIALAQDRQPGALLTSSTFASLAELFRDRSELDIGHLGVDDAWDSLSRIRNLDLPYRAYHGLEDEFILPRHAQLLAEAHPGDDDLRLVPGKQHERSVDENSAYDFVLAHFPLR